MSKIVPVALVAVLGLAGVGAWLVLRDVPAVSDDPAGGPRSGTAGRAGPVGGGATARNDGPAVPKPIAADEDGPPIPELTADAIPGAGQTFKFPECLALSLVDWNRIGIHCRRAQRLFRKASVRVNQGDEDPLSPGGLISAASDQIMLACPAFVGSIAAEHLDMRQPLSSLVAFPPFQANALAATLACWGRPLTDDQLPEVLALYREYFAVWTKARARVVGDAWPVEVAAEVSIARAALQPKLEAILDARQRSALWPPSVKGRVGLDLFSPAFLWYRRIEMVQCPEGQSAAKTWVETVVQQLNVPPPEFESRRVIAGDWLAALPKGFRQGVKGPLARAGLPAWEDIEQAVAGLPDLVRALGEGVQLEGPVQRSMMLFVPVVVTR
ncbi:MAG: hypothetical protein K8T90_14050 [Planctomycetes bacterium]|nr:hypothetical protein [Planctomycetota bacterium]